MASQRPQKVVKDGIWVRLAEGPLAEAIHAYLDEGLQDGIVTSATLPEKTTLGLVIVDDEHRDDLVRATAHNAGALQVIHFTADTSTDSRADFVLPADVDVGSVKSVLRAAKEFHDQVMTLKAEVARRKSAIGTIMTGQFVLRTLLINAVEHGNLEIDAALKQELLMAGRWRDEIEARLRDPEYSDRVVIVTFQRSERIISMTVQDEGAGFDHAGHLASSAPAEGYRGRGITMARDLSFTSLTYHGAGNLVEATILIEAENSSID